MNNIDYVKSNFCQFDCPFKQKNEYFYKLAKKIEKEIDEDSDLDCIEDYDKEAIEFYIEDVLNHEFDSLCKESCPLHKFIDRLKDEKLIQ